MEVDPRYRTLPSPEELRADSEAVRQQLINEYMAMEDANLLGGLSDNEPVFSRVSTDGDITRPMLYEQARYVDRQGNVDGRVSRHKLRGINMSRNTDDAYDIFVGYICQDGVEILGVYDWEDVAGGQRIATTTATRFFAPNTLEKAVKVLQDIHTSLDSDQA